jgi:hypothetical protein
MGKAAVPQGAKNIKKRNVHGNNRGRQSKRGRSSINEKIQNDFLEGEHRSLESIPQSSVCHESDEGAISGLHCVGKILQAALGTKLVD